jgi:hypothetical protein
MAGEQFTESDDPGALETETQKYIGMRPAFQEADRLQASALRELWGGFESHESVLEWLHDLNEPSNGRIDPGAIRLDDTALKHLLDRQGRRARRYRETVAISVLLPAFVRGVQDMSPGELAARTTQTDPWNEGGNQ